MNPKRVHRLYSELGLQLRHRSPKRRVKAKLREGRAEATRANETWAMDFARMAHRTYWSRTPRQRDFPPQDQTKYKLSDDRKALAMFIRSGP